METEKNKQAKKPSRDSFCSFSEVQTKGVQMVRAESGEASGPP